MTDTTTSSHVMAVAEGRAESGASQVACLASATFYRNDMAVVVDRALETLAELAVCRPRGDSW